MSEKTEVEKMCTRMMKTGALPRHIKNVETAMLIVQAGAEMGMEPVQSIYSLYPVNGKIVIDGKGMLRKLHQGKIKVEWIESTSSLCKVKLTREEDGLSHEETSNPNSDSEILKSAYYFSKPKEALRWCALGEAARFFCPDVSDGLFLLEEMINHEDSGVTWNGYCFLIETRNQAVQAVVDALKGCKSRKQYMADILPEIANHSEEWSVEDRIEVKMLEDERMQEWSDLDKKAADKLKKQKKSEQGFDGPADDVADDIVPNNEDEEPETAEELFTPEDGDFNIVLKNIGRIKKQSKLIEYIQETVKKMPLDKKQDAAVRRAVANQIEEINGKRPDEQDMALIYKT